MPLTLLFRRRQISVRALAYLLVLAMAAPVLTFLTYLWIEAAMERREALLRQAIFVANAAADALEDTFQSMTTMLAVFASSGWIEEEDYATLHRRAQAALRDTGTFLILLDPKYNQMLNTRVPYGAPLGPTSNTDAAQRVQESRTTFVSDVFAGRVANAEVFNVMRPATNLPGDNRVLILTRNIAELERNLRPTFVPQGWHFAVFDTGGKLAFGSRTKDDQVNEPHAACNWSTDPWRPGDVVVNDHEAMVSVITRVLSPSAWRVCIWPAADVVEPQASGSWGRFAIVVLVVVVASLLVATSLIRLIITGLAQVASVAGRVELGEEVADQRSPVREMDGLLAMLRRAAHDRLNREEELRLLLGETAHRAKNQMAVACSLVRLSARSAHQVTSFRDDLLTRFAAITRSVDTLAGRNWHSASLIQLVKAQLEPFIDNGRDRLTLRGDDIEIAPTAAQSLGLVLNELATNASKYGAWSVPAGRISVSWHVAADTLDLTWLEADGPAPKEPDGTGFGTKLIDTLVRHSFGGNLSRDFRHEGLSLRLNLPLAAVRQTPPALD